MPSGEKRPPADRKCTTLLVMMIVPSGVRAWRACQRVKDRETGWLARREDRGRRFAVHDVQRGAEYG